MQYSETIFNTLLKFLGLFSRKKAVRIADFLGRILFNAAKKHRKIALDNLTYAFGHEKQPEEIHRIAQQVFTNLVLIVFELAWSLQLDERHLSKQFKIGGFHHLEKAHEKGKGVLVLTAHLGNWELLSVLAEMIEFPMSVVFRPLDSKPLNRYVQKLRSRFGGKMIPKQRSFRKIIKCLAREEIVYLLMDQNVDWYEGVFVDFMGHPACTNKGLALLALKMGSPVVPVFMVREKSGLRAEFGPEVVTVKTGDRQKDIEINTQEYNRVIENYVRRFPDQWLWVHQRWKTKPYQAWPRKIDG